MTTLERQNFENIHKLTGLVDLAVQEIARFRLEHDDYQVVQKVNAIADYLKLEFVEKQGVSKLVAKKKK